MKLKGKTIEELNNARINNLDIIRFIAASLVLFSHAYPLTTGSNGSEPFAVWTMGQMTFGEFAVSIFFIISGFLITQSFDRSRNPVNYMKARALRIFPGLIVCVALTVFVLGPIFTQLTLGEYFTSRDTYMYFKTISLYFMQYNLPGVFDTNVWPNAVNGSLWTLWYEFFFYIVVLVLGMLRLLDKRVVVATFIISSGLHFFGKGDFYTDLFRYFSAGMILYLFRSHIKMNGVVALLSLLGLIVTANYGYFEFAFTIFGAYLIFYLAYETRLRLHNFGKYGDFSYGIYIYAFPIQQIFANMFNNQLTAVENFFVSFPITLLLAFASWHVVEKRALKYKNFSFRGQKDQNTARQVNAGA
ncbi:acyltransferase [Bacillus sp. BGMRC 2118]|nr:acyltransferase [Bacillus sp. BGMRC 2118]